MRRQVSDRDKYPQHTTTMITLTCDICCFAALLRLNVLVGAWSQDREVKGIHLKTKPDPL